MKNSKSEMINYFKHLAYEYDKIAVRNEDEVARIKAETYELVVFELENNMK